MTTNPKADLIKPDLEKIANSLVIPALDRMGYMYIPVIKKGVSDMSQGQLTAVPVGDTCPVLGLWHYNYRLDYKGDIVGEFELLSPGQAMVTATDLKNGIETALRCYPNPHRIVIDTGTFDLGLGKRVEDGIQTKYDHVFLAPPFPQTFRMFHGF